MPKRSLYILVFMLAGAMAAVFLSLLFIAWVLEGKSLITQVERLLVGLPRTAAFFGGLIGLFLGRFFWPRLYNEDGSLKFHDWKTFRKWLHRQQGDGSVRKDAE